MRELENSSAFDTWRLYVVEQLDLPVLHNTRLAMEQMISWQEDVGAREIAQVVMRDPALTAHVLRDMRSRKSTRHSMADVATIERAVLLLGVVPFLERFSHLPVLEDKFAPDSMALAGYRRIAMRARQAALYAGDWATHRQEGGVDEVMVAALLRDMAEMLMWCAAPDLMNEIVLQMRDDPALRSADIQQALLGFKLDELQQALAIEWDLPELLCHLMDSDQVWQPRVAMVHGSVSLARHAAHGWWDAAIPDDLSAMQKILGVTAQEAQRRVTAMTLVARRERSWYATPSPWVPPVALNLVSGQWYEAEAKTPEYRYEVWRAVSLQLKHMVADEGHTLSLTQRMDFLDILVLVMHGLQFGLGLSRVAFLKWNETAFRGTVLYLAGASCAAVMEGMEIQFPADTITSLKGMALRDMQDLVRPHLPPILQAEDFMVLPLESGGCVLGLMYVDGTPDSEAESVYARVQEVCSMVTHILDSR